MRLRSSHFVFVVLLLCSVQLKDNFTLQLVNGEVVAPINGTSQRHGIAALPASEVVAHGSAGLLIDPALWTRPGGQLIAQPGPCPLPARAAAAVSNHTSLLRA